MNEQEVKDLASELNVKKMENLKITLPLTDKKFAMKRSSGRMQLVAQKIYDPGKKPTEFTLEVIRQTLDPQPTFDELIDLPNEDLDVLQVSYARFNRTGKYSITEREVEGFFVNQ